MAFEKIVLPYALNELEPYIDETTVDIHHNRHHQTYVDKLNTAIEGTEYENMKLEDILKDTSKLPETIRTAVHNNGGGVYNHNLYFDGFIPGGCAPSENMLSIINDNFGSLDNLIEQVSNAAINQFGSGRGCLAKDGEKLVVYGLANQDTALAKGHVPLLMLDVWEHAYYLKSQNKRPEYVSNFWNLVNWDKVEDLYNNYRP